MGDGVLLYVSTSELSRREHWPDVQVLLLASVWNTAIMATMGFTAQVRHATRHR